RTFLSAATSLCSSARLLTHPPNKTNGALRGKSGPARGHSCPQQPHYAQARDRSRILRTKRAGRSGANLPLPQGEGRGLSRQSLPATADEGKGALELPVVLA